MGERPHHDDTVSYEEFGRLFMSTAVTPERIAAAIRAVAGEIVEVGPFHAGPGAAARVMATGTVASPRVRRTGDDPLSFAAELPVTIDLSVRLAATTHTFAADVTVPLRLVARTVRPLTIVIEIAEVQEAEIDVQVHPGGLRHRVLRVIGNMDEEIRTHVAEVVRERVDSERSRAARVVEVASLIDRAWRP